MPFIKQLTITESYNPSDISPLLYLVGSAIRDLTIDAHQDTHCNVPYQRLLTDRTIVILRTMPLRSLRIYIRDITDEGLSYLSNLSIESLQLMYCDDVTHKGLSYLSTLPLTSLSLHKFNRFFAQDLSGLKDLPLRHLCISDIKDAPEGINWPLESLYIQNGYTIAPQVITRLLQRRCIKSMTLNSNIMPGIFLEPASGGPSYETRECLESLEELTLRISLSVQCIDFRNLNIRELSITCGSFTDDIILNVSDLPLEKLHLLTTFDDTLTDAGMVPLAQCTSLKDLHLSGFKRLTSEFIVPLLGLPIRKLHLERCFSIRDHILMYIVKLPLVRLVLDDIRISDLWPLQGKSLDELCLCGLDIKNESLGALIRSPPKVLTISRANALTLNPVQYFAGLIPHIHFEPAYTPAYILPGAAHKRTR